MIVSEYIPPPPNNKIIDMLYRDYSLITHWIGYGGSYEMSGWVEQQLQGMKEEMLSIGINALDFQTGNFGMRNDNLVMFDLGHMNSKGISILPTIKEI